MYGWSCFLVIELANDTGYEKDIRQVHYEVNGQHLWEAFTHTHRETHTHRDTHTETHTQRHTHRDTHTHRERDTHSHRDTHRHTHTNNFNT